MFSHISVGTNNLLKAEPFYDALLFPLSFIQRKVFPDGGPASRCWVKEGSTLPRFYVYTGYYGAYLRDLDGNKLHIVFRGDLNNR